MKSELKKVLSKLYHKTKHLGQIIKFQSKRGLLFLRRQMLTIFRDSTRKHQATSPEDRVLIFNIFEPTDRLQEYKKYFLEALVKEVAEVLIVVNGELNEADQSYLNSFGQVLYRENKGYDAAAFKAGILHLGREKLATYGQLLLVNDTNVGPFYDLAEFFAKIDNQKIDFWGISMGEPQIDFTLMNPYGYIYPHIQTFFLVIEKNLLGHQKFYDYWENLGDTDSRDKAIGRHETVFTRYFWNLGFRYTAIVTDGSDSAIYIHPLTALKAGSPIVKYTALGNYDAEQFLWQDLVRESEVPALLDYVRENSDFPIEIMEDIVADFKKKSEERYVLIIDGVENAIPQCTRYRVLNKAEQLRQQGYEVVVSNLSEVNLKICKNASHMIIYRCPDTPYLNKLVDLAKHVGIKTYYDIDDLVFDTQYTDQLAYTQGLSAGEKVNYDNGVRSYGRMLDKCDAAITSTTRLVDALKERHTEVILNRNVLSKELVDLSLKTPHQDRNDDKVRIGYFSGAITHNENFELIKEAIKKVLDLYPQVELHLIGHLELPEDMEPYAKQLKTHPYVDWKELPALISSVDINLAPLVSSTFNRAKSEIKWLEAAVVKVPTLASKIGAFEEMVIDGQTGFLATDQEWFHQLCLLIDNHDLRQKVAQQAFDTVIEQFTTASPVEIVS